MMHSTHAVITSRGHIHMHRCQCMGCLPRNSARLSMRCCGLHTHTHTHSTHTLLCNKQTAEAVLTYLRFGGVGRVSRHK